MLAFGFTPDERDFLSAKLPRQSVLADLREIIGTDGDDPLIVPDTLWTENIVDWQDSDWISRLLLPRLSFDHPGVSLSCPIARLKLSRQLLWDAPIPRGVNALVEASHKAQGSLPRIARCVSERDPERAFLDLVETRRRLVWVEICPPDEVRQRLQRSEIVLHDVMPARCFVRCHGSSLWFDHYIAADSASVLALASVHCTEIAPLRTIRTCRELTRLWEGAVRPQSALDQFDLAMRVGRHRLEDTGHRWVRGV